MLSEVTRLDAYLLKFWILLTLWLQQRGSGQSALQMSSATQGGLHRDQLINHFFRLRWLRSRAGSAARNDLEINDRQTRRNAELSLADHLLPQFLHLSFQLQPPESDLSRIWMNLASSFMVHAAIEILDAPDILKDGTAVAKLALEECFAWGYVVRNRFVNSSPLTQRILDELSEHSPGVVENSPSTCKKQIQDAMILEDDCWELFYDEGISHKRSANSATPQSSGELSDWTVLRQASLDEVLTTFAIVQEEHDSQQKHEVIQWLCNKYPLSTFLSQLVDFMAKHWTKWHSSDGRGKPILVQIEEGGLQGLSSEEFADFRIRARIEAEAWLEPTLSPSASTQSQKSDASMLNTCLGRI